jgi:hypothetical protein
MQNMQSYIGRYKQEKQKESRQTTHRAIIAVVFLILMCAIISN